MIRIGVDPGIRGAIAVVEEGKVLSVVTMPTVGEALQRTLNYEVLDDIVQFASNQDRDIWWVVERVHSMPRQGVASTFTFGRLYGLVEGYVRQSGLGARFVTPYQWKSTAGLLKVPKNKTPDYCMELIPSSVPFLAKFRAVDKKVGAADAILIARFGWNG